LREQCTCESPEDGADRGWNCHSLGRSGLPGHPTTLDETKAVAELTDVERQAWCAWYEGAYIGPGSPPLSAATVDADGYVAGGITVGWSFSCMGAVIGVAATDCAKNLALSTCTAPVSELSDCMLTILDMCFPAPSGCARYLETPGCDGTVIMRNDGTIGTAYQPKLKVE
jgi:hypothetical protein